MPLKFEHKPDMDISLKGFMSKEKIKWIKKEKYKEKTVAELECIWTICSYVLF